MKAISLWQPWASLVALGAKQIETRHWQAPAAITGQRIAIHAAKRESQLYLCDIEPFSKWIAREEVPLGAIVATAVLDRSVSMTVEGIERLVNLHPEEHAFGNYAVGRFAWVLRDVKALRRPIPFKGRQGVFDVPEGAFAMPEAVA